MESKGIEITRFGKQPKVYKVYELEKISKDSTRREVIIDGE